MTDDDAREIVRATLAHHVHGTRHGYTHAEVRQALERALVLFDEVERLRERVRERVAEAEGPVKPFGLTLTTPLSAEDRDQAWDLVWELAQAKDEVERLRGLLARAEDAFRDRKHAIAAMEVRMALHTGSGDG